MVGRLDRHTAINTKGKIIDRKKGRLKAETEGVLIAAQDQNLPTNV